MPTFQIIRDHPTPRVISFGHGSPVQAPVEQKAEEQGERKMADEKKLDHESGGPDTIHEEDPGTQGAVGSGGENAPAQEKGGTGEKAKGGKNG